MSNISFSSGYGEYTSGEFFQSSAFELKSNDQLIFSKEFLSNSPNIVNLTDNYFLFPDHIFVTGEELIYDYFLDTTNLPISIATTVISGVSTNKLPQTLYAVKQDSTKIKVAASKTDALLEDPKVLDLTGYGRGIHRISSKNPNINTLITINNIIQHPIVSTSVTSFILESINDTDLSVTVNNPGLFNGGDFIKIDDEFFRILSVGIGTTNNIFFERSFLGTSPESHYINSQITKIKGNYNIVGDFIYFTKSLYGSTISEESRLNNSSTFSGRVFLRSGIKDTDNGPYDSNYIIDDISIQFDGKTPSFTLQNNFTDVTGISTDNAIVTLNDVFQQPSRLTGNIINGAYVLGENSGITTITFTGNDPFPEYDVNISEIPRGGILLSVGSTGGFGYQPLISAGATAIVSAAGTIQSISIGYSGSGYRSGIQTVNVGVALSDVVNTSIELIGTANISDGKIISINITNPGSGYTSTNPPEVVFDSPLSYSNIPLVYSSESIGSGLGTGASIDVVVGQGSSVIDFTLRNLGYAYEVGEILTIPFGGTVGIPTGSSFEEFKLIVSSVYGDNAYIRTIGQLVIFDPIDSLFNGQRKVFPLKINNQQTAVLSRIGSDIDVQNTLLIFIDSVLQVPGEAYIFDGGSIITFTEPPRSGSKSTILFYAGTEGVDTLNAEVLETIKKGDNIQIFDNTDELDNQNLRTAYDILSVDVVQTNLYGNQGISVDSEIRPLKWCPQDVDKFISGSASTVTTITSKDRLIYEPLIEPTSYLIKNISSNDTEIFVDNVKTFFDNKNESSFEDSILIISQESQVSASATATVSIAGTIQSINFLNSGYGYTKIPQISISNPVSSGTTALVEASINSLGEINSISITNSGTGYTYTNPPLVIIEQPKQNIKIIEDVLFDGDFGIISGVGTTTIGVSTCLILDLFIPTDSYLRNSEINNVGSALTGVSGISTDYYIYIENTNIGTPIISLDNSLNVLGIGSTFIDNVYQVKQFSIKQKPVLGVGITYINEIIVNVNNNSSLIGIAGSGYYGDYSWGRISNISGVGTNFNSYAPGITTSTIVKRYNPLKYSNYLN